VRAVHVFACARIVSAMSSNDEGYAGETRKTKGYETPLSRCTIAIAIFISEMEKRRRAFETLGTSAGTFGKTNSYPEQLITEQAVLPTLWRIRYLIFILTSLRNLYPFA